MEPETWLSLVTSRLREAETFFPVICRDPLWYKIDISEEAWPRFKTRTNRSLLNAVMYGFLSDEFEILHASNYKGSLDVKNIQAKSCSYFCRLSHFVHRPSRLKLTKIFPGYPTHINEKIIGIFLLSDERYIFVSIEYKIFNHQYRYVPFAEPIEIHCGYAVLAEDLVQLIRFGLNDEERKFFQIKLCPRKSILDILLPRIPVLALNHVILDYVENYFPTIFRKGIATPAVDHLSLKNDRQFGSTHVSYLEIPFKESKTETFHYKWKKKQKFKKNKFGSRKLLHSCQRKKRLKKKHYYLKAEGDY